MVQLTVVDKVDTCCDRPDFILILPHVLFFKQISERVLKFNFFSCLLGSTAEKACV